MKQITSNMSNKFHLNSLRESEDYESSSAL